MMMTTMQCQAMKSVWGTRRGKGSSFGRFGLMTATGFSDLFRGDVTAMLPANVRHFSPTPGI